MPRRRFRWPELNRRQTRALVISLVLALALLAFPPWVHEYHNDQKGVHQVFAGYHFIGSPPVTQAAYQLYSTHMDYLILLIELLGVAGFAYGALRTMSDGLPRASTRHRSHR